MCQPSRLRFTPLQLKHGVSEGEASAALFLDPHMVSVSLEAKGLLRAFNHHGLDSLLSMFTSLSVGPQASSVSVNHLFFFFFFFAPLNPSISFTPHLL